MSGESLILYQGINEKKAMVFMQTNTFQNLTTYKYVQYKFIPG